MTETQALRHVIVGTSGHIDHGKTRLVGRLTNVDTDRLPEEKARGISIDLGFANWREGDVQFGVVDVPGHERFVRNMVAGATGVNVGMLVVAADDGVMPQTREHLEIMDLLGLQTGLVTITKTDLVEGEFVELVQEEVRDLTEGTFLEGCPIVPVSSETGEGLDDLRGVLTGLATKLQVQREQQLFRMPIDRVFSITGHGSVVTGSVLSGQVQAGDVVELLPEGREVRVRSVQNHGMSADDSGARQRTAVNLAGVKAHELRRGQELADPGYLVPTTRLIVEVRCLTSSPIELGDRIELSLHLGTTETPARLLCGREPILPGERRYAELRLKEPIVATWGQRFILRRISPAVTVGGGMVIDPGVEALKRLRGLPELAAGMHQADEQLRLSALLRQVDRVPDDPMPAARRAGIDPARYPELVAELEASGSLVAVSHGDKPALMHALRKEAVTTAVLRVVREEIERRQPRRSLPEQSLLTACREIAEPPTLQMIFAELLKSRELVRVGPNIGPADAQVRLTKKQQAAREMMLAAIQDGGLTPPTRKELATATGQPVDQTVALLTVCAEDGLLVQVSEDLWYAPSAMEEIRQRCARTLEEHGPSTLAAIRDGWGVTRKFAVPLCEWCDDHGLTLRNGDLREPGPQLQVPLDGTAAEPATTPGE